MLQIYEGALNVFKVYESWYKKCATKNYGAIVNFTGVVRNENSIEGLSFDIYEPILKSWFNAWQDKMKKEGAIIFMAHSTGDVLLHESSFICFIASPKRKVSLKFIEEFVEDFKASAPIWKYDIRNSQRMYAKTRSTLLPYAGILKGEK